MPEKIASGVIHHQPPGAEERERERQEQIERLRLKRDGARGTLVLGVAMMFLGSGLGWGFAAGGAAMTVGGAATGIYWGQRLKQVQGDPWRDEEIDAWEREHFDK